MVTDNVKEGHLRYISGNVLTGTKIASDGILVTMITRLLSFLKAIIMSFSDGPNPELINSVFQKHLHQAFSQEELSGSILIFMEVNVHL